MTTWALNGALKGRNKNPCLLNITLTRWWKITRIYENRPFKRQEACFNSHNEETGLSKEEPTINCHPKTNAPFSPLLFALKSVLNVVYLAQ